MATIGIENRESIQQYAYQEVPGAIQRKYWREYLSIFIVALSMISAGFSLGWFSPTTPLLFAKYSISQNDILIIHHLQNLGVFNGCLITARLNDFIGRKKTLIITIIPYLLSTNLAIFSYHIICIKLSRFLAGLSFGAIITALPVYASEILSPEIRGKLSISISVSLAAGLVVQNVIGAYLSIEVNGLVTLIFGLITFTLTFLIPESPYFHLMNDDDLGATKSLRILRQRNEVSAEVCRIKEGIKKLPKPSKNVLKIFNKQSRKRFGISFLLFALQEAVGLNAIIAILPTILQDINSIIFPQLSGIILTLLIIPCIFVFTSLIDRLGRRKLLLATTILMGASAINLSLFYYFHGIDANISENSRIGATVLVYIYVSGIILSAGIPGLYLSEIMPTNTKTVGSSVCQSSGFILGSLSIQLHRILTVLIGGFAPYLIYFVGCIGMVGFSFYLPETAGKTLEDIQNEWELTTRDKEYELITNVKLGKNGNDTAVSDGF